MLFFPTQKDHGDRKRFYFILFLKGMASMGYLEKNLFSSVNLFVKHIYFCIDLSFIAVLLVVDQVIDQTIFSCHSINMHLQLILSSLEHFFDLITIYLTRDMICLNFCTILTIFFLKLIIKYVKSMCRKTNPIIS